MVGPHYNNHFRTTECLFYWYTEINTMCKLLNLTPIFLIHFSIPNISVKQMNNILLWSGYKHQFLFKNSMGGTQFNLPRSHMQNLSMPKILKFLQLNLHCDMSKKIKIRAPLRMSCKNFNCNMQSLNAGFLTALSL